MCWFFLHVTRQLSYMEYSQRLLHEILHAKNNCYILYIAKVQMISCDCPDFEWSNFAQSVVFKQVCHWQTDSLMCKSHLFQRRIQGGWSCTVSLHHTSGLPHPFLHTHRTKWNFNLKDNQIRLVLYIFIRSVRQQCKKTAPCMEPIHPFWEHAVYSAALFVTQRCTVGDVLLLTSSGADIFLQWVMVSELSNTERSGGEIDPSCSG